MEQIKSQRAQNRLDSVWPFKESWKNQEPNNKQQLLALLIQKHLRLSSSLLSGTGSLKLKSIALHVQLGAVEWSELVQVFFFGIWRDNFSLMAKKWNELEKLPGFLSSAWDFAGSFFKGIVVNRCASFWETYAVLTQNVEKPCMIDIDKIKSASSEHLSASLVHFG